MRPQPLICVRDVEASSQWYQRLLDCQSDHGGPNYERLVHTGKLVLQLHRWEEDHHHGPIGDPLNLPPGNGLLLWFEVDDIDAAIARAEAMRVEVILPRHRNPSDGNGGPRGCLHLCYANCESPSSVNQIPQSATSTNCVSCQQTTKSEFCNTTVRGPCERTQGNRSSDA